MILKILLLLTYFNWTISMVMGLLAYTGKSTPDQILAQMFQTVNRATSGMSHVTYPALTIYIHLHICVCVFLYQLSAKFAKYSTSRKRKIMTDKRSLYGYSIDQYTWRSNFSPSDFILRMGVCLCVSVCWVMLLKV